MGSTQDYGLVTDTGMAIGRKIKKRIGKMRDQKYMKQ